MLTRLRHGDLKDFQNSARPADAEQPALDFLTKLCPDSPLFINAFMNDKVDTDTK
jgi:hypothetical protein